MRSLVTSLLPMLLLLGCASNKPLPASPPAQVECPKPAPLARMPLGQDFLQEAESVLFDLQNVPTKSVPASQRATGGPTR